MDTSGAWFSSELPELTQALRTQLLRVGYDPERLRQLSRSRYGVTQIRSVLLCFTEAYPGEQPGVADVARVGEAWRLASHRPTAELHKQLTKHGLDALDPEHRLTPPPSGSQTAPKPAKPLRPRTPGRAATGWLLVVLLIVFQALLGFADLGIGIVVGGIGMIVGWFLPVRRLVYGRHDPSRRVKVGYVLGTLALCYATASTGAVAVMLLGTHGVGHIAYADTETGSHGTRYQQCYVDLPDHYTEPLRTTGHCPAPDGTAVGVYYLPGGDSPLRPVLDTANETLRTSLLWGLPTALGLGLIGFAAVSSLLDPLHTPLTPRNRPTPKPQGKQGKGRRR